MIKWTKGPPNLDEFRDYEDILVKDDDHVNMLMVVHYGKRKVVEHPSTSHTWDLDDIRWYSKVNDPDKEESEND